MGDHRPRAGWCARHLPLPSFAGCLALTTPSPSPARQRWCPPTAAARRDANGAVPHPVAPRIARRSTVDLGDRPMVGSPQPGTKQRCAWRSLPAGIDRNSGRAPGRCCQPQARCGEIAVPDGHLLVEEPTVACSGHRRSRPAPAAGEQPPAALPPECCAWGGCRPSGTASRALGGDDRGAQMVSQGEPPTFQRDLGKAETCARLILTACRRHGCG